MRESKPLVSIGIPIYNGERYITQALDSLLAQDFDNFELIISDNASQDSTQQLCLDYISMDRRIRYYRNDTNLGAVQNFNHVFALSSGKFFMWAAHHDLWEPTFITQCVNKLNENPLAVLCFTPIRLIDREGNCFGMYDENIDTTHLDMVGRLHVVLWRLRWEFGAGASIYGLIRSDALRATRLCENIYGPDWILLAELSLLGPFVKVPEALFSLRDAHPKDRTLREQLATLDPTNSKRAFTLPLSALTLGLVKRIARAKINWWKKPLLILDAIYSMNRKFNLRSELMNGGLDYLRTLTVLRS